MFIVKESLVDKHVTVHDSLDQLQYRGRVRAVALHQQAHYMLLVEVTEVHRPSGGLGAVSVGELALCAISNEWQIVKLDPTKA